MRLCRFMLEELTRFVTVPDKVRDKVRDGT
jgi:hypothetical protein